VVTGLRAVRDNVVSRFKGLNVLVNDCADEGARRRAILALEVIILASIRNPTATHDDSNYIQNICLP
jgi:hypothetical protein